MIFKYQFVNHNAELLHELAKHIVLDIWCNASENFNINLITENNDFRKKVNRTSKYLKTPIEEIFNICRNFTSTQKEYIKNAFTKNNQIEALCNNSINPIFYNDLKQNTSEEFSNKTKEFFNNLYTNVFNQQPFFLKDYYDTFFKINEPLCPFCGLTTLEKDSSNHRDDFDHYLPKEKYPFNAVNLKNLLPMCSDCNKKWKKTKNPIFKEKAKKAFYYFGTIEPNFDIKIIINELNINNNICDVIIEFQSPTMQDEVDSWNRLFSLSIRYIDNVICHNKIGLGWIREIDARRFRERYFDIEDEIYYAQNDRLSNKNFIKAPFLRACMEKGIF
jgi:hypothetical protein